MHSSTVIDDATNNPRMKIAELQMMLSNDANKDKCLLLVEGADDRKFYSQFVDDKHIVISVLDGCFYMPQILSSANEKPTLSNRVLGIKDSDFDFCIEKDYGIDNLFTTDTHDWETMVMSEECENHVAIEALGRKEGGLFAKVMSDLTDYSYVKFFNEVEVCGKNLDGIRFRGFSISRVYDGYNPCCIGQCLSELKKYGNNSSLAHFPSLEAVEQFKQDHLNLNLSHLTCGHDVIHGIVCRLTFLKGSSPEIGAADIGSLFRASCTMDFFKQTNLYKEVLNWSISHFLVWAA